MSHLNFLLLFGSVLSFFLILISISNPWIISYPINKHSNESSGELMIGIFYGTGTINIGYGSRNRNYSIYNDIIASGQETNFIKHSLWILTTISTFATLICDFSSSIFSLLKSASRTSTIRWTSILFFINILSFISNSLAFISWILQFNLYFKHNILITKDQNDGWYSNDMSIIGYGFYIMAISIVVTLLNLIILNLIRSKERKCPTEQESSSYEEKPNGDIMLY